MQLAKGILSAALLAFCSLPSQAALLGVGFGLTDPDAPSPFLGVAVDAYAGGPYITAHLFYDLKVLDGTGDGASAIGTFKGLVDNNLAASLALNCVVLPADADGFTVCNGSQIVPYASSAAGAFSIEAAWQTSGFGDGYVMNAWFELTNEPAPVPEPSTLFLGAAGLGMLALLTHRR